MERPQMIINRDYHIQDDHDVYEGTLIRTSLRSNEYEYKFNNLRKLEIRPNQPNYYRSINGKRYLEHEIILNYYKKMVENENVENQKVENENRERENLFKFLNYVYN
jgi:hypothetical protein